jgi:hypothetical protein
MTLSQKTNVKITETHKCNNNSEGQFRARSLTASVRQYTLSAVGHVWLWMRPVNRPFTCATISSLETLHCTTRVGSSYHQYSYAGCTRSWIG